MTTHRQRLLAKLAPMFGAQTENLAVAALEHILSESGAARRALRDVIAAGGVDVGEIASVRTQATGEQGERPDLAGFDPDGRERVLIEVKFSAGLTDNQPVTYLERLPANSPSALLFVAPAARQRLWTRLDRAVSESRLEIALHTGSEVEETQSANAGGQRYLLLTSWQALLDHMATQATDASDSHTEHEIAQLRGLAEEQERTLVMPLRPGELRQELAQTHDRLD